MGKSEYRLAERRKLRIYATDPMAGRRARFRLTVEIDNEPLARGPKGEIIEVWDYDAWNKQFYIQINLDDPSLLMEGGLVPSESDPRFHQQMVYAVAMKVIESARRALGRPITFYGGRKRPRLRLFPHAFYGANAFFDSNLNAILFGYFRADRASPGPNLPSQTVYTCLSHDIIAHEVTHAIVHRLRPYFLEPTNVDVLAFHEAFSDIVALFQRFSYRDLLVEYIQSSAGKLYESKMLIELAQQFGYATGSGKALRSAIGSDPRKVHIDKTVEAHSRGAILVSAVFDGYFRAFQNRTADLIRIATGGSGQLPQGHLHPDLVHRLATEASLLAERFLRMCFRAFDYMPPVDVTFGDFLRALVTSDFELNPEDREEVRYGVIEAFRERRIYPAGVHSLAEESLLWPNQINGTIPPLDQTVLENARRFLAYSANALDQSTSPRRRRSRSGTGLENAVQTYQQIESDVDEAEIDMPDARELRSKLGFALHSYVVNKLDLFGLDPGKPVAVRGFHAAHRIGVDQRLIVELVAQFVQTDETHSSALGGIPFRAGATVIFGGEGEVRYVAAKPMMSANLPTGLQRLAESRLNAAKACVAELDLRDPKMTFADESYRGQRTRLRAQFRALHEDTTHG